MKDLLTHNKDKETKNTGEEFHEGSMVGTDMEALGDRLAAKVATIEVSV